MRILLVLTFVFTAFNQALASDNGWVHIQDNDTINELLWEFPEFADQVEMIRGGSGSGGVTGAFMNYGGSGGGNVTGNQFLMGGSGSGGVTGRILFNLTEDTEAYNFPQNSINDSFYYLQQSEEFKAGYFCNDTWVEMTVAP
jgi:hypothetical protein